MCGRRDVRIRGGLKRNGRQWSRVGATALKEPASRWATIWTCRCRWGEPLPGLGQTGGAAGRIGCVREDKSQLWLNR